ncbi:MAG: MFS transporter, partial [Chloroflexi bacterium]|nr:MFS transporter [Chloroflexota bacterium]
MAGAVLMTMMISGAVAAPMFSVFIPRWSEEFGWSRTAISGAFSFGTIAAALAGPLVGRALDKYGGRLVMGGGALLMGLSVAGLGFVGSLAGLYAALVVARTALMSIQNLGGHTVIANWFVRRRALATAVAVNGSRLGLGLWPLLGAVLIAAMGWREALWTVGALMALLALFPLVAIVSRQPEDVGLQPDGRVPSQAHDDRSHGARAEHQWRPREAIRTQAFWLLLFAHMGAMLAGGGFGLHRIPLFLDRGLEESWVGPVLMLHAVGMLVGGFVAAWFMGRTSYRVVIAGCMAGASA